MEKKQYHHRNLREQLIEAGIQIMNETGYENLSLRKIAAACSVSHAAPYRHFASKEELLKGMQEYVERRFAEILRTAIERGQNQTHPMIEFGKAYVTFFRENPQYYTFVTRQEGIYINFSAQEKTAESNYRPFLIFREEAKKHLQNLGVPKEGYLVAMTGMWAGVHGLAGMATMSGVHYDGDWELLTEMVLKGMGAHE